MQAQFMGDVCISDKITTVPRLFSEHLTQNENKHQIMNVHTKWKCLIPILSGLVKYQLFQARKRQSYKSLICVSGKITTVPILVSHSYSPFPPDSHVNLFTTPSAGCMFPGDMWSWQTLLPIKNFFCVGYCLHFFILDLRYQYYDIHIIYS